MEHQPRMSSRVEPILNDEKIFSYDVDRYTATKVIHHFKSDPKEGEMQFRQCLKRE